MSTDKDKTQFMGGTTQKVPRPDGDNSRNKLIIIVLLAFILLLGGFLFNRFVLNPGASGPVITLDKDGGDGPGDETGIRDPDEPDPSTPAEDADGRITDEPVSPPPGPSSGTKTRGGELPPKEDAYAGVTLVVPTVKTKLETGSRVSVQNSKKLPDVSYDFGDGATARGGSAAHSYERPGRYTITAKGPDGRALDSKEVVIHCSSNLIEDALQRLLRAIRNNSESQMLSAEDNIKGLFNGGDGFVEMYSKSSSTRTDNFRLEPFFDMFYSVENPYSSVKNLKTDDSNGKIKVLQLSK